VSFSGLISRYPRAMSIVRSLCLCGLVGLLSAKDAVVVFVVDPSWDCVESYAAHVPLLQEYKIIKVWTTNGTAGGCNSDHWDIYKEIRYNSNVANEVLATEEICPMLKNLGLPIAAVIPTFDPTVGLTDRLASCVGTRGNPFEGRLALARSDKWAEAQAVKTAGLRSVQEKLVTNWREAKEYLETWNPPLSSRNPAIYKILQGSSGEGVHKIHSLKEAEEVFAKEIGTTSWWGSKIGKLLIQEYLQGDEYVIDSVSRDGVHKTVVVWNEDLRPGNGIFNLYYGFKAQDPEDPKIKKIIEYAHKVLTATGLSNGASDMEVKWIEEEGTPCLLDLNARWTALMWHDGLALEKALVGNDQITATINAYLDADAFNVMPTFPTLRKHGALIFAESMRSGILQGLPGVEVAKKLTSFLSIDNHRFAVGDEIFPTIYNPALNILLANKDKAVVDADYNHIIDLELTDGFFDIKSQAEHTSLPAMRTVTSGVQRHPLLAIAALATLAVALIVALTGILQRNVRDGTEYLTIE